MARPRVVSKCPFNIPTVQVARGLIRIHQLLRGELDKVKTGHKPLAPIATVRAALGHIERIVSFLGFLIAPDELRSVRVRAQAGWPGLFPIPTLQTARTLIRLHRRLRGELAKRSSGERLLVEVHIAKRLMTSMEALMPVLGVDFDAALLRVVRTRIRVSPFGYGEIRAGILTALRASSEALTYQQLADALLAKHGTRLTIDRYRHFLQKVREAVYVLKTKGLAVPELSAGFRDGVTRQRWRFRSRLPRQ